jgi:hypothetical protein
VKELNVTNSEISSAGNENEEVATSIKKVLRHRKRRLASKNDWQSFNQEAIRFYKRW